MAKAAGQLLLAGLNERRAVGLRDGTRKNEDDEQVEKENAVDIVTKTDTDVETFVHETITSKYPQHGFVGEETYSKGASRVYSVSPSTPTWVVDPLDGTVNYTHGFSMFCVSIALVYQDKPIVGVIYAPLLNQLFSAYRGGGAWLNETISLPMIPGRPMPKKAPSKCVFSCEWGKDRRDIQDGNLHRKVDSFLNMASERSGRDGHGGMVHGVRSLGSATLDLAYIAMGSFDIWWEGCCWEWDVAAGICLVEEAGGLVVEANCPPDEAGGWQRGEIRDARIGSRLYLAIRPAAADTDGETGRQGQERTIREV